MAWVCLRVDIASGLAFSFIDQINCEDKSNGYVANISFGF